MDELPVTLWTYRTTLRQPTGETPYALASSAKAQIPIEFGLELLRAFYLAELAQSLDELKEKREQAAIRMAKYQRRATWQVEGSSSPWYSTKGNWSFDGPSKKGN